MPKRCRLAAELADAQEALTTVEAALARPGAAPNLLTVNEAAAELRVSRSTVFELVSTGQLASSKPGKRRLISVARWTLTWINRGPDTTMSKAADGRSTLYLGADTYWHGYVSFGVDPVTGRRRRRHVRARSKSEAAAKVKALEAQRESGFAGGPATTVSDWLEAWVAAKSLVVRPKTLHGYVPDIRRAKARLGKVKLSKVTPEQVETLYLSVLEEGQSAANVAPPPHTFGRVHRRCRAGAAGQESVQAGRGTQSRATRSRPTHHW